MTEWGIQYDTTLVVW